MDLLKIAGIYKVTRIERICLVLLQEITGRENTQVVKADRIPGGENLKKIMMGKVTEDLEKLGKADGKRFT